VRTRYAWLALSVATIAVFAAMKAIGSDVPPFLRLATFFCSGACFYLYREMIEMNGRFAFFFFGLLTIGMFSWRGAELALATAGAYVMIYLATKRSAFFSRYNRLPDISYGIYLYGWPVQKLLIWYIPAISPWILTASASLIVIILGYASWHLVEKQMLRFKGTRLALAAPLLTDPPP
jgi:peptidoglycan/LPS O-acetylase OafA/YrhL